MSEAALAKTLLANSQSSERGHIVDGLTQELLRLEPGDSNGYLLAGLIFELHDRFSSASAADAVHTALHTSHISVLTFICKTIRSCQADVTQLTALVEFCNRHTTLLNTLVSACEAVLIRQVSDQANEENESSVETGGNADKPIRGSPKSVLSVLQSLELGDVGPGLQDGPLVSLSPYECLSFLKVLLFQFPAYGAVMRPRWLIMFAVIVGSHVQKLSSIAKDVLLSLLATSAAQSSQTHSPPFQTERDLVQPIFWIQVFTLAANSENFLARAGLAIWLRLLSVAGVAKSLQAAFATHVYWELLQIILASGSNEQRKMSIAIFRRSVLLCESDIDTPLFTFRVSKSREYKAQFVRFATVFETIVIEKYVNQVQDCLADLNVLSSDMSLVQPSWMMTLLHASLLHGMQETVRKIIGSWTLRRSAAKICQSGTCGLKFLEIAFLPWATMGPHFNASVLRESVSEPSCLFGEELSRFLSDAITSPTIEEERLQIIGSTLRFVALKGGRISSFARAFILQGLMDALCKTTDTSLDKEHMSLLCQITQQQGFQEIVRDLMVLQCYRIYQVGFSTDLQTEQYAEPIIHAHKTVQLRTVPDLHMETAEGEVHFVQRLPDDFEKTRIVFSAPYDEAILRSNPIQQLTVWLKDLNNRRLSGLGLLTLCNYIYDAFENEADRDLRPMDVCFVVKAIWANARLQDYPRYVMMALPRIIFHRTCVCLIQRDNELAVTLDSIARTLWDMAKTRIYLFSPIATALRQIFLDARLQSQPFAEFILDYANGPPSTRAEFELERVMADKLEKYMPARTYEYYYGKPEAFGHACVFDTLNRLPPGEPWDTCCSRVLERIISRWADQKHPIPVVTPWKTTAQLQIMLMCSERLVPIFSPPELSRHLSQLLMILSLEPLPRFRFLLEWIIIRVYVHVPNRRMEVIESLAKRDISNPKFTVSMIKIAFATISLPDTEESLGRLFMAELVSLSASQKVVIRHEAHWTTPLLWDHSEQQGWMSIIENVAFARLNRHIRGLEVYKSPPAARLLEQFNPIADHTLVNLVCGKHTNMEPALPSKVSQGDFDALRQNNVEAEGSRLELMPLGTTEGLTISKDREQHDILPASHELGSVSALSLQTKSSTWHYETVPQDMQEMEGGKKRAATGVIVVASLIDSPYNLGGISRVSEIFGINALKVKSLNVTKSKDFMSVSVSSHMWLPIEELGTEEMAEYVRECKLEGYKVVGMEQTDNSQVLGTDECRLPWKMVLVLGSEKEGIPAELLADMDFCIEVRHAGVTRSMNVQTALSVGLYEYQRQHGPL